MSLRSLFGPRLTLAAVIASSLAVGSASAWAQSNTVSAASPATCITSVQSCANVPVQISRTDATALLAFSVTFTLSPELSLCSPPPAISEGNYLHDFNSNTSFHVRDLGGGTYTADGTMLGQSNCGPTAASGTLFNIHVTNAGGSGTGSVTVSSVILRNCSNGTIASTIGSAASVTIDLNPVTVDPIADPIVAENTLLSVTPNVTISSCATGPASWTATGLPSGASLSPTTGVVTWTPDCLAFQNGPDYGPLTVTAHAVSGETGSASFTIHVTDNPGTVTVTLTNPPAVEELSALAMAAPSAALSGCASGAVTWSVSPALPSGATLDSGTGVVSWTPTCGQAGSYGPFTLKATAASGEFGTAALSLTVTHKVGTVTVATIPDATVAETVLLTVTPSAPTLTDCAAGPMSWTATGLPAGALIDAGTGVVTWTPDCEAAETDGGLYGPVVVTAHASTGEFGSTSFHIQVTNTLGTVAVAPIADPQTVAELATLTVTPSAMLTGCARAPLVWSQTGLPVGASFDPGTGVVTWTPDCAAAETNGGVYGPVTITATAVEGESDSKSFSIHVTDTPVAIAQVTGLTTSQVTSGNGAGQTTAITVSFTPPVGATSIEVYRAPFGNYPEYDDAPSAGSAPASPTYPPGAPWVLTSVTASGQTDSPASRDFWYYVAFAKNVCGEVSLSSSVSAGALNYHLGDVSNGITAGTGDNQVSTADISLLGQHYGVTGGGVLPYNYLDVGPTSTNWVDGRPLTDDAVDFEDLVIFALNYGLVSAPDRIRETAGASSGSDRLSLASPSQVSPGDEVTAKLSLHSGGALSAISVQLSWDPAVVAPVSSAAGDWLLEQGGIALTPKPGSVDVAALRSRVLTGEGTLATVSFRVLAAGDPRIQVLQADGRDARNQKLSVILNDAPKATATPAVTQLAAAVPNPSAQAMSFAFSLAQGGAIDLSVYTVSGRHVKTLVHETRDAGNYRSTWSGRDDAGVRLAPGAYYARLTTPQGQFTRVLTLLK